MPKHNKAPTMAEIAAASGFSKMTVSLALRGSPRIKCTTRDHIVQVAERMNYRPNPLVQALMANIRSSRPNELRSKLAWVTAFPTKDGWREHWIHEKYYDGAVERANALGYEIEPIWAFSEGMSCKRLSDVLRARGIVGLIIPPVVDPNIELDIEWEHFASATIGYSFMEPKLHRSAANLYDAMNVALNTCKERGYRRIGFVTPADTETRINYACMAMFLAWQQFLPEHDVLPILYVEDGKLIENVIKPWIEANAPQVIISPNREFIKWLHTPGFRVPEDIGLVLLSSPDGAKLHGNFAGINQNERIIGGCAVDLVVSQIQQNEIGLPEHPQIVSTQGVWENGSSLLQRPNLESLATKAIPRKWLK